MSSPVVLLVPADYKLHEDEVPSEWVDLRDKEELVDETLASGRSVVVKDTYPDMRIARVPHAYVGSKRDQRVSIVLKDGHKFNALLLWVSANREALLHRGIFTQLGVHSAWRQQAH